MKFPLLPLLLGASLFLSPVRAEEPAAADATPPSAGKKGGNLSPEAEAILVRAGNAATDQERLDLFLELQKRTDLSADFRTDLDNMIRFVRLWEHGYEVGKEKGQEKLDKYLAFATNPVAKIKEYAPKLTNNPILKGLVGLYMGRARVQGYIQTGSKMALLSPADREAAQTKIIEEFSRPRTVLPDNPIAGMYAGYPIPWPKELEIAADPKAPEWANLQREGLEKLGQVLRWWIETRQKPEGFFGSGWNDDVEIWRSFVPLTVAFSDPQFAKSQGMLSEAIFSQPHMAKGFSSVTGKGADAEHISEDSSDTITPMLFLAPDEDIWKKRTLFILDLAKGKWSGTNERGQLQFKSTYFNVDGVETETAQACDTIYHARTMQPVSILWQRGVAPEAGSFFLPWMKTWVDASMREENGKPAGIVPTVIHWPDGKVGGVSPQWWKPGNFHTVLYNWPSASEIIVSTMLLCNTMTDDPKYLEPLFAMAQHRRDFLAGKLGDPKVEGSLAWAADQLKFINPILAKYRLLSGDERFDDLLKTEASGYVQMRLGGGREAMVDDLRKNAEGFRQNFEAYTSDARAGDRITAGVYRYFALPQMPHPMNKPKIAAIYETATGNPSMSMYGLTNAVRWVTPPKEIAALVTDAGKKKFAAELYHFGDSERNMEVELLTLDPGDYTITLKEAKEGGKVLSTERLQVQGEIARQKLILPSRDLCLLTVNPSTTK